MSVTDVKLSEKFDIEPIQEVVVEVTAKTPDESDQDRARTTLQGLIDKGEEAVNGILRIADVTESPRAYEVAGQLIKTVSEVAKDLVAIQKKVPVSIGKQTNVFVGSTKDVMKMIRDNPEPEVATTNE